MKRALSRVARLAAWLVLAVLGVEALCMAVITTTNYLIYGNLREGPKAVYDPYALFLMDTGVWPTEHVAVSEVPALNRTIWFFGGSTMRAASTTFDKSIPSLVARDLNATGGKLAYNCFNFGVNSFNSLLEVKYFQKLLIEFPAKPNLVVFYDGANDANYFAVQGSAYAHEGRERVRGLLESYYKTGVGLLKPLTAAYYASFTRELLEKLTYTARAVSPDDPELALFVDLTVKRYDFIERVAALYGSRFLLFLQPLYWVETCPDLPPELRAAEGGLITTGGRLAMVRENFTTVYAALAKALAGRPYFVDIRDALCSRRAPAYEADGVHNTDAGRDIVARAMLPAIRDRLASLDQAP